MGDWSGYIPQIQACSADDGGGIFSLDGAPWCQYGSLENDTEAVKNVLQCCKAKDTCKAPIKIRGQKQMVLRADEDELIAKNGTQSAVVAKVLKTCVVIGVGGEGKDARTMNTAMCKLADYLAGCGY